MVHKELVTVYIPTKNRCELLQSAVDSVLNQSYKNFELIIVDDGSTDGTGSYLETLVKSESRVKVFSSQGSESKNNYFLTPTPNATPTKSRGACFCRNLAIKNANGHFITGLDDDDEFTPDRLQTFIDNYDPKYAFICAGFYWDYGNYRKKVNHRSKIFNLNDLLNYNHASNQVFVERDRMMIIDGFDETFVACQDYDTWTRLMQKFGQAKRLGEVTYIVHRDQALERLTKPSNWLKGHSQFMEKHQALLSAENTQNQQFKRLMVKQQRLGILQLTKWLKYGLVILKLRYFLTSKLKNLASSS